MKKSCEKWGGYKVLFLENPKKTAGYIMVLKNSRPDIMELLKKGGVQKVTHVLGDLLSNMKKI